MTKQRDPLGKRALFSGGTPQALPTEPATQHRKPGPFDMNVHCLSCNASTTLGPQQFVLQHVPVFAWLPVRKHSRLMRCPACSRISWLAVSRAH